MGGDLSELEEVFEVSWMCAPTIIQSLRTHHSVRAKSNIQSSFKHPFCRYAISFPLTLLFTAVSLFLIFWVHANRDLQMANYMEQKSKSASEKFEFDFEIDVIANMGKRAPVVEFQITRAILSDPAFWMITVGMPSVLGLFLPLLNLTLMKISVLLNDFENYRTESEYRTYLVIKVFSFRFVCYFATLYYYAFVSIGSETALENGLLR